MFKLSIAFIAILLICETYGDQYYTHKRKADRMGYQSGYGGGYGTYGGGYDDLALHESMGYDSYEPYKEYMPESYGSDYGHEAYGSYEPSYGHSPSYGGMSYGSSYGSGYGGTYKPQKTYKPQIYMKKSIEVKPMYGKGYGKQYNVKVPSGDSPVKVMFLTQHTPVHVQQKHKKGAPEYKKSTTHEEPHVVVHEVIKPVIQEIREVIVPYRKVIQKIQPVQEEVKTIVHKDHKTKDDDDYEDDKYKKSYRKYKKDDDEDEDKKYYKKERDYKDDDDDDEDKYKKSYRKSSYKKDEEEDDRYHYRYHKKMDDKKYEKYGKDDYKEDRIGQQKGQSFSYSEQINHEQQPILTVNDQGAALVALQGLAASGNINNGMTLASIYGGDEGSLDKKSS